MRFLTNLSKMMVAKYGFGLFLIFGIYFNPVMADSTTTENHQGRTTARDATAYLIPYEQTVPTQGPGAVQDQTPLTTKHLNIIAPNPIVVTTAPPEGGLHPPTTEYQTTAHPTTAHETTAHPTTYHPTTAHPTTAHETTAHPTTAHPTTAHETTAHPTTAHLTTAHPTTAHPTTAHPTTAHPTTAHTTIGHPTTAHPTTHNSTAHQPTTAHPTTAHPTTAHPTTHHPTTAHPTSTPSALPDCPWGAWTAWSECDCRSGLVVRIRKLNGDPNGNCEIRGCSQDTKECAKFPCPIDCVYSNWSSWSKCKGQGRCGDNGKKHRHRYIRVPALYGGKKCSDKFSEEEHCKIHHRGCDGRHRRYDRSVCHKAPWSDWSECIFPQSNNNCDCTFGRARFDLVGYQIRERIWNGGYRRYRDFCPNNIEKRRCHQTCC